jgi:hypothetical protein
MAGRQTVVEFFVEELRNVLRRLVQQTAGVAMFEEARAEPWEPTEPPRRALVSIPGSGPQRRRSWRRLAVAAIATVLIVGNALLIRDIVVTRSNADRLRRASQHAQVDIATRQNVLERAQAALAAARTQLAEATRARDRTEQSDASTRSQAVSRSRQLAAVHARIDTLHHQIDELSNCVGDLQGPLNDTSSDLPATCGATR